jgi:hypothetical protein
MMMLLQFHAMLMMLQLLCCVDDEKKLPMIYRCANQCSKMILMMLSSHPPDAVDDAILSCLMLL